MRKDYIKKCIESVSFLGSSSLISNNSKKSIIEAGNRMMNECWKVEYKSLKGTKEQKFYQMKCFWNDIHTELVGERKVYDFLAVFDDRVNPPRQRGNVELYIKPKNTVEVLLFKLKRK